MYQALGDTLKSLAFASLADQLTDTPFISEEITAETLIESDLFHTSFPDYTHYDSDTLHNAASWIINTSLSPSILPLCSGQRIITLSLPTVYEKPSL